MHKLAYPLTAPAEHLGCLLAHTGLAMSDKYQPVYCVLCERPTIYLYGSGRLAWWCKDGAWAPAPWVQCGCNAPVMSESEFENCFGQLPPFPKAMLDQIAGNATTQP